jgi:hypothetical protein
MKKHGGDAAIRPSRRSFEVPGTLPDPLTKPKD